MTIGEKIKKIRLSQGLTLDEVAKRLGYSNRSAFYKIENEDNGVTIDKLKNIANALGVTLEDLLYDESPLLDAKEVIKKAEDANLIDDILYKVYNIHKETYYDMAIIAPSWKPEKVFNDDDNIILLKNNSHESSYEIYSNDLKIAYIQCGPGASSLTDAMLCLTNANIKNIFFIGAVGSLSNDYPIATIVTPKECISFDGVTPFFKTVIEKKMYGSSVYPHNVEYIDKIISIAKQNDINIQKEKVFCTDSILLEYSHMDEILATGSKLIEMETAAFYTCLKSMNKNGMALLVVSDNSQDKKSLISKTMEDKDKYNYVRHNVLRQLFNKISVI